MAPIYSGVDPSAFNQQYEDSQSRRSSSEYQKWSPKRGLVGRSYRNIIRIAPPHVNMHGRWCIVTKVHFSLGPNQDVASPCLEFFDKECPACLWVRECEMRSRSEPDPLKASQYRDLSYRQKAQWNYCCSVQDTARPEAGWLPYWHSNYANTLLFGAFYDLSQPPQWRDITHPEHGYNVIMDMSTQPGGRPGQDFPKYDLVTTQPTPTPLIDMKLLEMVPDLTREVYEPTAAEVMAALQGQRIDRRAAMNTGRMVGPAPAAGVLPAPPGTPVTLPGVAVPVGTPSATVVQPAPSAPPVAEPAGRGRGRGRPSAPAPIPGAPAAPMVAPPAAPVPAAPTRQAVTMIPGAGPYAAARAYLAQYRYGQNGREVVGVTPRDITPGEAKLMPKQDIPPCYEKDTEPSDPTCQKCVMLLPCVTVTQHLTA